MSAHISLGSSFILKSTQDNGKQSVSHLWNNYYSNISSSLQARVFREVDGKESIEKVIGDLFTALQNQEEDLLGVVIYRNGVFAYMGHVKEGKFTETRLKNWDFYLTFLKPQVHSLLKKSFKEFFSYQTDQFDIFKVGNRKRTCFESKGNMTLRAVDTAVQISNDHLIKKGGPFLQSVVSITMQAKLDESLKLDCSNKTLQLFKEFLLADDFKMLLQKKLDKKSISIVEIENLFVMANQYYCIDIKSVCSQLLKENDHLVKAANKEDEEELFQFEL